MPTRTKKASQPKPIVTTMTFSFASMKMECGTFFNVRTKGNKVQVATGYEATNDSDWDWTLSPDFAKAAAQMLMTAAEAADTKK